MMGKKITERSRLKVGDLVVWESGDCLAVYQIAKLEKNKHGAGGVFACLNKSPDHKEFKRENGVDLYTRIHQIDLIRTDAEVISVIELVSRFEHSNCVIRDLKNKLIEAQTELSKTIVDDDPGMT